MSDKLLIIFSSLENIQVRYGRKSHEHEPRSFDLLQVRLFGKSRCVFALPLEDLLN